ncbi:hypothetical protein ACNOYE_20665 [Nannocystaceae bacterium ST9]
MTNSTKILSLFAVLGCGCEPKLEELEVGDEAAEGDTGSEDQVACLSGTDLAGQPGIGFQPDCPVECSEVAAVPDLAIAWTSELELGLPAQPPDILRKHHIALHDDRVLIARSGDTQGELISLAVESGELIESVALPGMPLLLDLVVGPESRIYATWRTSEADWVGEISLKGETLWAHHSMHASQPTDGNVLVRTDGEGLLVLDPYGTLARFDLDGGELDSNSVDVRALDGLHTSGAVGLGGDFFLNWFDAAGELQAEQSATIDEVSWFAFDLAAIADDQVAVLGSLLDFPVGRGMIVGFTRGIEGARWSYEHRRAESWCAQEQGLDAADSQPTTGYDAIEGLADGRVLVGGWERLGYPFDGLEGMERPIQPLVDLLVVEGTSASLQGRDRGLWLGHVLDVVEADDGAYALMTHASASTTSLVVRKYDLPE